MRSMQFTYWAGNGRYQSDADALNEQVPLCGEMTPDSPLELFRLASNLYYDLYNNGLANAEVRLPPFLDEMKYVTNKRLLPGHNTPEIKNAINALDDHFRRYQIAEEMSAALFGDDEDDYQEDPEYPDPDYLFAPMEVLMNAVIEYSVQSKNPALANPALSP